MDRPNVIFIMADQLKATTSNLFHENGIATPALERLAQSGVLYENTVTPHPLCVPARAAIMTSRYPHSTGARRNETLMPEGANHAFRIWKREGFTTGLIGKNHCFDRPEDLVLLDVYCEIGHRGRSDPDSHSRGMEWVRPVEAIDAAHATRRNMPRQTPQISHAITDYAIENYGTSLIAAQTVRFLELHRDDPFALWVSFPDPHEPREVPRMYAEMFPPDEVTLPPWKADEFDQSAPQRNRILRQIMDVTHDQEIYVRQEISVYQAMTRFVDDGVGQILDAVEQLGLRETTIVVFAADHGDFVGEHGMNIKGGVFYDCLTRVPLIVSWPANIPEGVIDRSMANTVDIVPTLFVLQGIDIPGEMQGVPLPTATDAAPRDEAFSEYGAGGPLFTMDDLASLGEPNGYETLIQTLWVREAEGRRKMVRTAGWKYVHDPMGDLDELYDLIDDPWEQTNVASDPGNAGIVSEMRARLAGWMIRTEDPTPVPLPKYMGPPHSR